MQLGRPRTKPWGNREWLYRNYMSKPGLIVKPRINCESHFLGVQKWHVLIVKLRIDRQSRH
jgi:hypothetical protein